MLARYLLLLSVSHTQNHRQRPRVRKRNTKPLELLMDNCGHTTITGAFTHTLTPVSAKADLSALPRGCHLPFPHSALHCQLLWSPWCNPALSYSKELASHLSSNTEAIGWPPGDVATCPSVQRWGATCPSVQTRDATCPSVQTRGATCPPAQTRGATCPSVQRKGSPCCLPAAHNIAQPSLFSVPLLFSGFSLNKENQVTCPLVL